MALFDEAAALYRSVLASAAGEARADAAGGLGEALQRRGEACLAAAERDPGAGPHTARDASAAAAAAFKAAVQAYTACGPGPVPTPPELVDGGGGPSLATLRTDAAVNAANTLCAWAAAEPGDQRSALARIEAAIKLYQAALAEEQKDGLPDAGTALNLADALAQRAGVLATAAATGAEQAEAVRAAFAVADAAYASACGVSSSERGDDLPGLLVNWATATAAGAAALGGDAALLSTAASRFREAASFSRGDPAPLVGLGDALVELAGTAAVDGESARLLEAALGEGYGAALALDRRFADAHAGVGDARLAQCRAAARRGDAAAAVALAADAAAAFARALEVPPTSPRSLSGWAARFEVRWNAACALALAGRVYECVKALEPLLAAAQGGLEDAVRDADLGGCPGVRAWLEAKMVAGGG